MPTIAKKRVRVGKMVHRHILKDLADITLQYLLGYKLPKDAEILAVVEGIIILEGRDYLYAFQDGSMRRFNGKWLSEDFIQQGQHIISLLRDEIISSATTPNVFHAPLGIGYGTRSVRSFKYPKVRVTERIMSRSSMGITELFVLPSGYEVRDAYYYGCILKISCANISEAQSAVQNYGYVIRGNHVCRPGKSSGPLWMNGLYVICTPEFGIIGQVFFDPSIIVLRRHYMYKGNIHDLNPTAPFTPMRRLRCFAEAQ